MSNATIRRGSRGPDVIAWQNVLRADPNPPLTAWQNSRGQTHTWPEAAPWPLEADGSFGALTELATEAWQAVRRIGADGIVGPATWTKALGVVVDDLPPLIYGTDVSAMQGDITAKAWDAMREIGIRLALARACVGNEAWIDATAANTLLRAGQLGIAIGLYFFAYPLRHIDPRRQVDDWARRCEQAGIDLGTVICALDQEWPPREQREKDGTLSFPWKQKWNIEAEFIREWNLKALERGAELTGRPWLFYSFRYHLQCLEIEKNPEFAANPLWLADYFANGRWPSAKEVAGLKVPGPWAAPGAGGITMVQHDGDKGLRMPNGVDADFNVLQGGERALRKLFGVREVAMANMRMSGAPSNAVTVPDTAISGYRRERFVEEPIAA